MKRTTPLLIAVSITLMLWMAVVAAQNRPPAPAGERPCSQGALDRTCSAIGVPAVPLPPSPIVFDSAEQKFRAVVLTKELVHPWALAFLPDGAMLVTERPGRVRIVRNGALDPKPLTGVPPVQAQGFNGLMDVAVH